MDGKPEGSSTQGLRVNVGPSFEEIRRAHEAKQVPEPNPKAIRRDGALFKVLSVLYPQEPPELDSELLIEVFNSLGVTEAMRKFILKKLIDQGLVTKKVTYNLHPDIWHVYLEALIRAAPPKSFLQDHEDD